MRWCWRHNIDSGTVFISKIGSHGGKNMAKIRYHQEGLTLLWMRWLESKEYLYIKQFVKVLSTCSFKKTVCTLCLITNIHFCSLLRWITTPHFCNLSYRRHERASQWQRGATLASGRRGRQSGRPPGQSGTLPGCIDACSESGGIFWK